MRSLQKFLLVLSMAVATGLLSYEIVSKSDTWLGDPLPGWYEAQTVERWTAYVPWTGSPPIDCLIHEGQEAATYYSLLLRRGPRSVSRVSRSPRIDR